MKRVIGLVLAGLGGFLLVLAPMLRLYAVPHLAKAPLVPGQDSGGLVQTVTEGTAAVLFDLPATLSSGKPVLQTDLPVVANRFTRGDVMSASLPEAKADDLAVYDSFSRLTDEDENVLAADTMRVSFDRTTAELGDCCGANVNGKDVAFAGINPLRFPFFVEKRTYDYFDATARQALPARYAGEEELFDMSAYVFVQIINPTEVSELELPGGLIGSKEESVVGERLYSNIRTLWVDPVTGTVLKSHEQQKQTLRVDGQVRMVLSQINIGGTDEEVERVVADTRASSTALRLMRSTIPLACLVLAFPVLAVGLMLARRQEEDFEYLAIPLEHWAERP